MKFSEFLEKLGITKKDYYSDKFNELKSQFLEMGQLKSDFDIEKFTTRTEGKFIAHNFHMLMRQYVFALYEARRMFLEREELIRKLSEYENLLKKKKKKIFLIPIKRDKTNKTYYEKKYLDIEIEKLKNEIDLLEVTMVNELAKCDRFEKMRLKLIEMNGGVPPTNEQYQAEEPEYWKWFLTRVALYQIKERLTGISENVWRNVDYCEDDPVINPNFKLDFKDLFSTGKVYLDKMEEYLKNLDTSLKEKIEKNLEKAKKLKELPDNKKQ